MTVQDQVTPVAGQVSNAPPSAMLDSKELAALKETMKDELREELRKEFLQEDKTREDIEGSVPFGSFDQKLAVFGPDVDPSDPIPGYHCHWINDEGDRIPRAQMRGYEFVKKNELHLNTALTPLNKDEGDFISCYVGSTAQNTPMRAYLMKMPLDVWKKQRQREQLHNDQIDAAIRRGQLGNQIGNKAYLKDMTNIGVKDRA
jgi:hypothetical protein